MGTNNEYKPDLTEFVDELSPLCKITEYDMQGYVQNSNGEAMVRFRLVIERENGTPEIITDFPRLRSPVSIVNAYQATHSIQAGRLL